MPTQEPMQDNDHTSNVISGAYFSNAFRIPRCNPAAGPPPPSVIALFGRLSPRPEAIFSVWRVGIWIPPLSKAKGKDQFLQRAQELRSCTNSALTFDYAAPIVLT